MKSLWALENSHSLGEQRLALQPKWELYQQLPKLLEKPNQIVLQDCGYHLETFKQSQSIHEIFLKTLLTFKWQIVDFTSQSQQTTIESQVYGVSGLEWQLVFYPKGQKIAPGFAGLYLECLSFIDVPCAFSVGVTFQISLKNHNAMTQNYQQGQIVHTFAPNFERAGYSHFIATSEFTSEKGYINNDSVSFEIQFHKIDQVN